MMTQELNEVKQVCRLKCAMLEGQHLFQILLSVLGDELVWRIIHQRQQFTRFIENGCTIAPGKDGGEEARDLDVGLLTELMRNRDRIVWNKRSLVVLPEFLFQQLVDLFFVHCLPDGLVQILYEIFCILNAHAETDQ